MVPGGVNGHFYWEEKRWKRTISVECSDTTTVWENIVWMGKEKKRMREHETKLAGKCRMR